MADYAQPPAATRRVRYFDGQFLQDQDFIDEQKYHLDRERRLGKVLRVTGVVEGLAVAADQANRVRVTAGTAIDADGRQLVLAQDRLVDLPAATFNDKQGIKVVVLYREQATDLATTGSKSERRWLEDPQIVAVATDGQTTEKVWNDKLPTVLLANLRLDNRGTVTVDSSVTQFAGMRVPGSVGIGGDAGPWRLTVQGRTRLGGVTDYQGETVLSVAPGTVQLDAPNVPGGRLVVNGTNGNVGIGNNNPGDYKLSVGGRTRLGSTNYQAEAVLSVAPGTIQFDAPGVVGGRFVIDGTTGNVGIGTGNQAPRSGLDTGSLVANGAINDYQRAQFTMSGGGAVTWGGRNGNGRLKWTHRFIAISMERGRTFSSGYVDINQPKSPIPAANVYDGAARAADDSGVVLTDWEALYAVHPVGGSYTSVSGFYIRRYTHEFNAPSNWLLVALVNGDDNTVKLGTGVILAAKSTSTKGDSLPTGTILMWSGAIDAIPEGWALCDGKNKTPDLQSRFVVGAGPGGAPSYSPNTSGEADQHTHRVGFPGVSVNTLNGGGHNHAPPAEWYDRRLSDFGSTYNAIDRGAPSVKSVRTSWDGDHARRVDLNIPQFDTQAYNGTNRPKWFALAYIMKTDKVP